MLELSGGLVLERDVTFDVVNGSVNPSSCAGIDVSGTIDDGTFTAGIVKIGDGLLDLAAGNTFGGPITVRRGTVRIAAESALGDGTATLAIDGGCVQATGPMVLSRDLSFGADGGSLRVDGGSVVEIPGDVAWGAGEAGFFGAGSTILSGTTSGSGGDLELGAPTAFASGIFSDTAARGHVLSLRGTSALPSGNLNITEYGVLELGSGDFTRALGTGPGEVQFDTAVGGGWAAHGADRVVNLGGASDPVVLGQASPPFLFKNVSGNDYGRLILGNATATHELDFQNPIQLNNGTTFVSRRMEIRNGAGPIDARLSGGISQSADPATTYTSLGFYGDGTLEISGPMSGEIEIFVEDPVTLRLTGANTMAGGDYYVNLGSIVIGGDASLGDPEDIFIETPGTFDCSALTGPVGLDPDAYFQMDGTMLGSVATESYFEGHGAISGDLHALAGCYLYPKTGGTLTVGGDFTLDATALVEFYLTSLVPDAGFNRMTVAGAVNLSGNLGIGAENLVDGDSAVLILNDGSDPINGTFAGLPEGAGIPIGGGLAIQVTYQANGDGGSVANDFGISVVPDTFGTDLALTGDGPLAVAPSDEIVILYAIDSTGPGTVGDGVLDITLPANATLVGSTPAGTVNAGVLSIPLPALAAPDSTVVELRLTAPGTPEVVTVEASVSSTTPEVDAGNNVYTNVVAVIPGGCPMLDSHGLNSAGDRFEILLQTVNGVLYAIQRSTDLEDWTDHVVFIGDGNPYSASIPVAGEREFFRVVIVPQNGNGGGGGGE